MKILHYLCILKMLDFSLMYYATFFYALTKDCSAFKCPITSIGQNDAPLPQHFNRTSYQVSLFNKQLNSPLYHNWTAQVKNKHDAHTPVDIVTSHRTKQGERIALLLLLLL